MAVPSGWPRQLTLDEEVFTYATETGPLLQALAGSSNAEKEETWFQVLAYPMEEESQQRLAERYLNPNDPFGGFACVVLLNRMCIQAFGIELSAAAVLSGQILAGWFPFTSWCFGAGFRSETLQLHELFPAAYQWLHTVTMASGSKESEIKANLAKLNRRIFGTNRPW